MQGEAWQEGSCSLTSQRQKRSPVSDGKEPSYVQEIGRATCEAVSYSSSVCQNSNCSNSSDKEHWGRLNR